MVTKGNQIAIGEIVTADERVLPLNCIISFDWVVIGGIVDCLAELKHRESTSCSVCYCA